MAYEYASKSVQAAAGSTRQGMKSATYPAASSVAPQNDKRPGLMGPRFADVSFNPNEHHVTMSEADYRNLGVMPQSQTKVPNRSVAKQ